VQNSGTSAWALLFSGDNPTVARPTLAANQMEYLSRVLTAQHDEDAMAKKAAKKKKAKGKRKKK
jgi:hypothetical protein